MFFYRNWKPSRLFNANKTKLPRDTNVVGSWNMMHIYPVRNYAIFIFGRLLSLNSLSLKQLLPTQGHPEKNYSFFFVKMAFSFNELIFIERSQKVSAPTQCAHISQADSIRLGASNRLGHFRNSRQK